MFFDTIKRKLHAKGHDIHSPFAFRFITDVVYQKHAYYAFYDIENLLLEHQIESIERNFNRLSYRLVSFFKPEKVLEINSENGVNSLYITSPDKQIVCCCIEHDKENIAVAKKLQQHHKGNIRFIEKPDLNEKYDAVFIRLNAPAPDLEQLFALSSEDAFWVLKGIKSGKNKQFWRKIVNDDRARVTFDMKDVGIVVLKKSYLKINYLI